MGAEVAFDDGDGLPLKPPESGTIPDQTPHLAAPLKKVTYQVAPDETRPPSDKTSADFPGRHTKI